MGDDAAALPLETQVLAVRRRVDGNDHEETLTAMANLAATHQDMGDNATPRCR